MTNQIVERLQNFRNKLFDLFVYRADSTMDLIDAIAGQTVKESAVKISLCNLFRRKYSSITDVVDNMFRRKANTNPTPDEINNDQIKITGLISEQCPDLVKRSFCLFAVDCSSTARIYSCKMEDRGFVHAPTKIPGQKPITVGHQYSTLVYLPERPEPSEPHWVIPLSTIRVKSEETGTLIGIKQMIQTARQERFKDELCLLVADSAYSHEKCATRLEQVKNLVLASRMRNNRKFHLKLFNSTEPRKRGRPRIYGESWALNAPGECEESIIVEHVTTSGGIYKMKIERWSDRLDHGENKQSINGKGEDVDHKVAPIIFDAIRVTILRPNGQPMYKKPLWIMVSGERRREISIEDIARSYLQRYDIEHFFRFAKQQLLLTNFQTPDVRHEENWWWLSVMSYAMLYLSRIIGDHIRNPWEKKQERKTGQTRTPTQVQRSYEGIIRQIGTPACDPKPRGKSLGRAESTKIPKRKDCPIVKKAKICKQDASLAAA